MKKPMAETRRALPALFILAMITLCAADGVYSPDGEHGALVVRHIPNPVAGIAEQDSTQRVWQYRWRFITEVRNNLDIPVRITGFGGYSHDDGSWRLANYTGEMFGSDDFTEWYQAGDTVVGGWIGAGHAAADDNNWVRFLDPMPSRYKWVYTAEDSAGSGYRAEAEIELLPVLKMDAPWPGVDPGRLVPITGIIILDGGEASTHSQVHIYSMGGDDRRPEQTVTVEEDGTFALAAEHPGWYRIRIYCPGHERMSIPLVVDDADTPVELVLGPLRHDQPASDDGDAAPRVRFGDGRRLHELLAVDCIFRRARAAYFSALAAHEKEHGGMRGFRFDAAEAAARLREYMEMEHDQAVREYAAVHLGMLPRFPVHVDTATAREIFDQVPDGSLLWRIDPGLASNIAGTFKREETKEILLRIVRNNPDRSVRAATLTNLALWAHFSGNRKDVIRYYETLATTYSDIDGMRNILSMINPDRRVIAGKLVPEFTVELIDTARTVSNKSMLGTYYLVHFWATSCGPCVKEMAHLHDIFERYRGGTFTILSLSVDRDPDVVARFRREKWGMPWLHGFIEGGPENEIAVAFEMFGAVPKMIFVDPDGMIVDEGYTLRGERLDSLLSKHLDGD